MVTLAYRSDIDGLRGIAVLSVVLYHLGVRGFAGGYVGVDIFFVVSGYLITGIILREIQQGTFSVATFYERRIRRIFPALFATLAFVLATGVVLLTFDSFQNLGQSALAVTLFVSNMLFWKETGYFDAPASGKPLLHTWSLSVEEQFYILYPLVLFIVSRYFASRMMRCLAVIAGASLALSIYLVARHPDAAFYWAPARGWELLLGGLVVCARPPSLTIRARNALAVLGLCSIAAAVLFFDSRTPFPGLSAVLPTGGTALILYTGAADATVVSRMLNAKVLVGVGLISYSLYLLHWPMLLVAQQLSIVELTALRKVALLLLMALVSAASWRWIEQPFRSKAHFTRRQVFAGGGAAMSVALAVGLIVMTSSGRQTVASSRRMWEECSFRVPDDAWGSCHIGAFDRAPSVLLWGDSHAGSFATAVSDSASRHSRAGLLAAGAGCPALLMDGPVTRARYGPNSRQCRQFNDRMVEYVRVHHELTTIILAARWHRYGDRGPDVDRFPSALRKMLSTLLAMRRQVVIVGPVPDVGYDVPSAYRVARLTRRNLNGFGPTRDAYAQSNRRVLSTFEALRRDGISVIDVRDRLCGRKRCRVMNSGGLLYSDDNHLSVNGSHFVSTLFDPILASDRSPISVAVR